MLLVLPTLFSAEIIFALIRNAKPILVNIGVILCALTNRFMFYKDIFLPLGLREAFLLIIFLYYGYEIKKYENKLQSNLCWLLVALGLIEIVLIVLVAIKRVPVISYCDSNIGNIVVAYASGIVGSILIFLLFYLADRNILRFRILELFGNNSMYILGFHYSFLYIWKMFYYRIISNSMVCDFLLKNVTAKVIFDIAGALTICFLCVLFYKTIDNVRYVINENRHELEKKNG